MVPELSADDVASAAKLKPLVMVAEDNEDNRVIAVSVLEYAGFRVIAARTGAEALRLARAEQPALILMDIGMPELDGWSVTEALKADPSTRHILIFALTAHAFTGDREIAFKVGCDGYLSKPIEPRRLVREVQTALDPTGASWRPERWSEG